MRRWDRAYAEYLKIHFRALTRDLKSKLEQVVAGRAVPSTANIAIGAARKLNAAVLFFDIEGSSRLSATDALYTLNVVVPTIMRIVHDHDGYIEKNTGDGVMAIFTAMDDKVACKAALQAALVMFHSLNEFINPQFISQRYPRVAARVGIDFGTIYVSRVGVPQGSSNSDRSFLTAIGPAANIACRLQEQAGTNETWVGDAVQRFAPPEWQGSFSPAHPDPAKWTWVQPVGGDQTRAYPAWRFNATLSQLSSASTFLTSPLPTGVPAAVRPPAPTILSDFLRPAPTQIQPPSAYQALIDALMKQKPPS